MAQPESANQPDESPAERVAESYEARAKELAKREQLIEQRAQAQQQKFQAQQQQFEQQVREFKEHQRQYEHAVKSLEHVQRELQSNQGGSLSRQLVEIFAKDAQKEAQQEALKAAKRAMEIAQQQARKTPVPDDAIPRAFVLSRIKAFDAADVLQKIFADAPIRVAVDEPRNLLVVLCDEKMVSPVADLIQKLDQAPADADVQKKPETLQLRVVWIGNAETSEDKIDVAELFGPNVGDALRELGFGTPSVLHQTMVSTVVGPNNPGEFDFDVPVGTSLRLTGGGNVHMTEDERYKVYFELGAIQQVGEQTELNQVDGSVSMPLDHYMIVGTGALVPTQAQDESGTRQPCALIIQLKQAPRFKHDARQSAKTGKPRSDENRYEFE
jgi:hypothetical protein